MTTKIHATGKAQEALAAQVIEAERLAAQLTKVLESLGKREGELPSDVAWALKRTGMELESGYGVNASLTFKQAIARAGDVLNLCSPQRVDTDPLEVPHGVVVFFRHFNPRLKRQTAEQDKLIARFLREHDRIEILAHDTPWGARDSFGISGQKRHRQAFVNDPRWPKLQKALEDIYLAEHLPGYPSERPKRKIHDPIKYVFGA